MSAGNCFELALEPRSRFRAGVGRPWNLHGISSHPEAGEGTFLGRSGRGVLCAGFPASGGELVPSGPCPRLLARSWGRIKGLAALMEPHRLPLTWGFHGKRKERGDGVPRSARRFSPAVARGVPGRRLPNSGVALQM